VLCDLEPTTKRAAKPTAAYSFDRDYSQSDFGLICLEEVAQSAMIGREDSSPDAPKEILPTS